MHLRGALLVAITLTLPPALGTEAPGVLPQQAHEIQSQMHARKSAWITRLIGEFRVEGQVERWSGAATVVDRAEVHGHSSCSNIGAPGIVQCLINLGSPAMHVAADPNSPSAMSSMNPAIAVFGMYMDPGMPDADPLHIGHMQVDNLGVAEYGIGQLHEEILVYTTTCAMPPGNCQRMVQIEAPSDSEPIRMSTEIRRDGKLELRHSFRWIRTSRDPGEQAGDTESGAVHVSPVVPPTEQAWITRLVGKFEYKGLATSCSLPAGKPCEPPSLVQECERIGTGVGVRCKRAMELAQSREPAARFSAAFELWGFDPVARSMVNASASPAMFGGVGSLYFSAGPLLRDTVTLTWRCSTRPGCKPSQWSLGINAEGKRVQVFVLPSLSDGTTLKGRAGRIQVAEMLRITNEDADPAATSPRTRAPSPRRP